MSATLWEHTQKHAMSDSGGLDPFVPVDDPTVFAAIGAEIARAAASAPGEDFILMVDSQTASSISQVDAARAVADKVYVYGELPMGWGASQVKVIQREDDASNERFLIVLSTTQRSAVVGEIIEKGQRSAFQGEWTGHRPQVVGLARQLLERAGERDQAMFPELAPEAIDACAALDMHIMATLAQQLAALQRDIARDKNDLVSVLEILKAISSKRRAHDVLFIFVEQISRVVEADRCSVVQVWGGDTKGHVLASHEDETVNDLIIDLHKYPELLRAMETREKVIIADVTRDPLTREFARELRKAKIQVLMAIPIVLFDPNVGTLFLRVTRKRRAFNLRESSFCEIVAEAAANALERAHLFESIQRANERLGRLAITDALTGLSNRRHLHERLEDEFQRAKRYSLPLCCLMFDIDNFKGINDTYGHLQGDTILREIAQCINKIIRKTDLSARYGGEEFVVIMPQTSLEGAASQAERLRIELAEHVHPGMPPGVFVTVSIGVAVFDPETMPDCEALLNLADSALYEAKRSGKNKVVVKPPNGSA